VAPWPAEARRCLGRAPPLHGHTEPLVLASFAVEAEGIGAGEKSLCTCQRNPYRQSTRLADWPEGGKLKWSAAHLNRQGN